MFAEVVLGYLVIAAIWSVVVFRAASGELRLEDVTLSLFIGIFWPVSIPIVAFDEIKAWLWRRRYFR